MDLGKKNGFPNICFTILLGVMLVTILTIPLVQSAEAIKSDGTPTIKTLSKQICGVSFCDTEQEW